MNFQPYRALQIGSWPIFFGFFFGFLMFSVFDEIFFCVVVGNYVFVFLNFFCAEKQL